MTFAIPLVTGLLVTCLTGSSAQTCADDRAAFQYVSVPCEDELSLLNNTIVESVFSPTEASCAYRCFVNPRCSHGIFMSRQALTCHLASPFQAGSVPEQQNSSSPDCRLLKLTRALRCLNGGQPGDVTCSCPAQFYGRFCQHLVPSYCVSNTWAESTDINSLNMTEFQIKLVIKLNNGGREVHHLDFLEATGATLEGYSQFNGFLVVDETVETFVDPPRLMYGVAGGFPLDKVNKASINLEGTFLGWETLPHTASFMIIKEDDTNTQLKLTAFQIGAVTPKTVVESLNSGHRLMQRVPTQTFFRVDPQEAIFQSLTSQVSHRPSLQSATQFLYVAKKQTMVDLKEFTASFPISKSGLTPHSEDSVVSAYSPPPTWITDDCWYGLETTSEEEPFGVTPLLREMVLAGQDLRVVTDASLSSDVTLVSISDKEVVASLPPFKSPFDTTSGFGTNFAQYGLLGSGPEKRQFNCKNVFQSGSSASPESKFLKSVQWVLPKRKWVKLYTVNGRGGLDFGTIGGVAEKVTMGKNMRVCITYDTGQSSCFGGKLLTVRSTGSEVWLQSRAAMAASFDPEGHWVTDSNTACLRTEFLVSTAGWVRTARYTEGKADVDVDNDIMFHTMTWFYEY